MSGVTGIKKIPIFLGSPKSLGSYTIEFREKDPLVLNHDLSKRHMFRGICSVLYEAFYLLVESFKKKIVNSFLKMMI